MSATRWMVTALLAVILVGCASGPVRRVSEPSVRIQQLTVLADGTWSAELRLENFSSMPMRFDSLDLALQIGGQSAGPLRAQPAISVGPESADTLVVAMQPELAGKLAVAEALGDIKSIAYSFTGTVDATPEDRRRRTFQIERSSALSPAPGLPGVLR